MAFWDVFLISFMVALTGAMSPGPVFTYTIFKSIKAKQKGYLVGILLILGHAILELGLICIILLGIGPFLNNIIVVRIIAVGGGGLLIFFGYSIIKDLNQNKIDFSFLSPDSIKMDNKITKNKFYDLNPFLGGILFSISNPYWIIWWVTWGINGITMFSLSFSNPETFWAFFLGHEMGDALWYVPLATIVGLSSKFMTKKVYIVILIACAIFMIGFGLYLSISIFIS